MRQRSPEFQDELWNMEGYLEFKEAPPPFFLSDLYSETLILKSRDKKLMKTDMGMPLSN